MSQTNARLSRRSLFAGAATAGTVAAAVSLMPGVREAAPVPVAVKPPPAQGGGYHLSEHVRQYYKTTLV